MDQLTLLSDMGHETLVHSQCTDDCDTYSGTKFLEVNNEGLHALFIKQELQPDLVQVNGSNVTENREVAATNEDPLVMKVELPDYVIVKTESNSESEEQQNLSRDRENSHQDTATEEFELSVKLEGYSPHYAPDEHLLQSSSDLTVTYEDTKVYVSTNSSHEKSEHGQDPLSGEIAFEERMQLCSEKSAPETRTPPPANATANSADEKPSQCDVCGYKCTKSGKCRHCISAKIRECRLCGRRFPKLANLKNHMYTHTGVKRFQCNLCGFRCSSASNMKQHRYVHSDSKPFECDLCDYKCTTLNRLKQHRDKHSEPFSCALCEYRCTTLETFKSHIFMAHSNVKPCSEARYYECDVCHRKYRTALDLRKHAFKHSDAKSFECDSCEYRCNRAFKLKQHRLRHSASKPFTCDLCDSKYTTSHGLEKHKYKHTKPYECEYKCTTSHQLKRHKNKHGVHSPKTVFECEECHWKYTTPLGLEKHKLKHNGGNPFECDVCEYKCDDVNEMKIHKFKHSTEEPLKCELCYFECATIHQLKKHVHKHIG